MFDSQKGQVAMNKGLCVPLLMAFVCYAVYGATFEQLTSQGRDALGQHQYEQAAQYFNAALTGSTGPTPSAAEIIEVKLILAATYIELDQFNDATRICDEVLAKSNDPDSVKSVKNLKSKIAARTYYQSGIRDVRVIYQKTDDPATARHFMDYAIRYHKDDYTPKDILDQLVCLIDHEGYSSLISNIAFRVEALYGMEPQLLYGQLLTQRPALASNMDFLFDYGNRVGFKDCALSIQCLTDVIEHTQDPRQKAEALLKRGLVNIHLEQFAQAKADLLECQALVEKHQLADLKEITEDRLVYLTTRTGIEDGLPVVLPEWQVITDSGIVLEYQPGMEKIAKELLPELVNIVDQINTLQDPKFKQNLERVATRKADCLQFIASKIGMAKPGNYMINTFDDMLKQHQSISTGYYLHSFKLWDRVTLLGILRSGVHIQGIQYNKDNDSYIRTVSLNLGTASLPDQPQLSLICNQNDSLQSVIEATRNTLVTYSEYMQSMCEPYVIFHEAAEMGMVSDFGIRSAFRRWFCEGVAQYVAEQATRKFIGRDAYEHVIALYDPKHYKADKTQVDLLAWRAMEWEALTANSPSSSLRLAHYTFAVEEIRRLARRHGADAIARIMKRLSKLADVDRNPQAILDSIKSVTGEEIAVRLHQYGQDANDDFRGIAIRNMRYSIIKDGVDSDSSVELSAEIPVMLDGAHDIRIEFYYEILDQPAQMQIEVTDEATRLCHSEFTLDKKQIAKFTTRLNLQSLVGIFKQDKYDMKLMLNGKVFTHIPIVIKESRNP